MKKDVKIKLTSFVEELSPEGLVESSERTDNIYSATLALRDGIARIEYSERTDGGPLTTVITARGERITLIRHGAIESELVFERNTTHRSIYSMPPYSFDMTVSTMLVKNNIVENKTLHFVYKMTLGGADKRVTMTLTVTE